MVTALRRAVLVATCLACVAGVPLGARRGVQIAQAPANAGVFVPDVAAIRTGAAVMTLTLPDGRQATVELLAHEDRGSGDALWRGRVVGQPESQVLFTLRSGFVAGSIHGFDALYALTPRGGVHVLQKVDPASGLRDQVFDVPLPAGAGPRADGATTPGPQAAGDAEIDVLALYRATTRDPALEATIQGWVDYANTVFVNSQVAAHYRLLDARPFLSALTLPDYFQLGLRPDVTALRDWYGADVVSFVVPLAELRTLCAACDGVTSNANIIAGPTLPWSFHVTHVGSDLRTWVHEGGHVLGMNHEPGQSQNQVPFVPGAYGHFEPGGFGTVMSYSGTTIPHFSNPDVLYGGAPTGIAGQRDNANAARVNAPVIAPFRAPGPLIVPPATSGLNFLLTSPDGVQIAINGGWFASPEALSYEIERSTDGVTFTPRGTATTNTFADTTVSPGTTYHYRVRGTNYRGEGPWSSPFVVAVPATPAAPTNLIATAAGSVAVQLDWTDTSSTETRFVVEIDASVFDPTLGWEAIDEAPANATSLVVGPLPAATTMTFRVRAATGVVVSVPSNQASATTLPGHPGRWTRPAR
jgi:hypothetical protein